MWIVWVLVVVALGTMLALLFQLDDRSRKTERVLRDVREIVLRLDASRDAES